MMQASHDQVDGDTASTENPYLVQMARYLPKFSETVAIMSVLFVVALYGCAELTAIISRSSSVLSLQRTRML